MKFLIIALTLLVVSGCSSISDPLRSPCACNESYEINTNKKTKKTARVS